MELWHRGIRTKYVSVAMAAMRVVKVVRYIEV